VIFGNDTEAKVSAAISACVKRYSKLSIEIQRPRKLIPEEYSDLQGAPFMESTGAAPITDIEPAELAVPESVPRGPHKNVLEQMVSPPSRCRSFLRN
jgi:hypothetical protein